MIPCTSRGLCRLEVMTGKFPENKFHAGSPCLSIISISLRFSPASSPPEAPLPTAALAELCLLEEPVTFRDDGDVQRRRLDTVDEVDAFLSSEAILVATGNSGQGPKLCMEVFLFFFFFIFFYAK